MVPELYLIAPADADAAFAARLASVLAATKVAALLLPRGNRPAGVYADLVAALTPSVQGAGCAVLIEGEPALVRSLGVDGLHLEGPPTALKAAIGALKPDFIVGAGGVSTRHEAMDKCELGPDYIMFGPLSGAIAPADRELAAWWAETMEIPGVLSDPEVVATTADAAGCEFLALSASLWAAPDPAAAIAAIATQLEQRA
jgi:thiamine-phosphate pyrophosphorylase